MKIGFDIDGVLCDIDVATLRMLDNIEDEGVKQSVEEWYYRERKPLLNPYNFLSKYDEWYAITSRPKRINPITKKWIKHYYPHSRLIMLNQETTKDNTKDGIRKFCEDKIELKSKLINELELDVFFDDEAEVFNKFREICPNCKVIKYGGRIEMD